MKTATDKQVQDMPQRLADLDAYRAFLIAKLHHESSIRSSLNHSVTICLSVLFGLVGFNWFCLVDSVHASTREPWEIATVVAAVVSGFPSALCAFYLLMATAPIYRAVLYRPSEIAAWWYETAEQLPDCSDESLSKLQKYENSLYIHSLSTAVSLVDKENRERSKKNWYARRASLVLGITTLATASLWLASGVAMSNEQNNQSNSPANQPVNDIKPPPVRIEKSDSGRMLRNPEIRPATTTKDIKPAEG